MNDDIKHILERVKKMLAIANDSAAAEGERENAMRMAHKTLAKYNLSVADLKEEADDRQFIDGVMPAYLWSRIIANSIAHLFFCENYSMSIRGQGSKAKQFFIGREANAITAREMTDYVIKSIAKEGKQRMRENFEDTRWWLSFCKGASHRIATRCIQLRKEEERASQEAPTQSSTGTALVLASVYQTEMERNKALIAAQGIKVRQSKSSERNTDWSAHAAGREFGDKINLGKQLGNKSSSKPGGLLS